MTFVLIVIAKLQLGFPCFIMALITFSGMLLLLNHALGYKESLKWICLVDNLQCGNTSYNYVLSKLEYAESGLLRIL